MIDRAVSGGSPVRRASHGDLPPRAAASPPVSFVIIARNQLRTIAACIDSVFAAAAQRGLPSFEVIYVDSASSDGTCELVAERYRERVRIARLTGTMNAAIARNVGAEVATGETLMFLDGDMELDPDFLKAALDPEYRPLHPLMSGQLPEKFYDAEGRFLGDGPDRYRVRVRQFRAELGGSLLITRAAFLKVGGFRPELRSHEDIDLGLRLARTGLKVLMLPQPLAVHHTVEYFDWSRLGNMLFDGSLCYSGVIFRRHLLNPAYWPVLITHQRPTAVLAFSVLLTLAAHPAWLLLYLGYVVIKNLRRPSITLVQDLVGTTLRSSCFLLGVPLFYPAPVLPPAIQFVTERASATATATATATAPVEFPPVDATPSRANLPSA